MKSWKTTLTGIGGACALWLSTYLATGKLEVKEIVIGLVIAALGVLAKDFNKTGVDK